MRDRELGVERDGPIESRYRLGDAPAGPQQAPEVTVRGGRFGRLVDQRAVKPFRLVDLARLVVADRAFENLGRLVLGIVNHDR